MNITSEFLVSSPLSLHALQPNEVNKSNLGCHGSVQYIFSHGTIPELERPPPRASAIIPDPINPTFVFELLLIVFSNKYFKFNVFNAVVVVVVCWCKKKKSFLCEERVESDQKNNTTKIFVFLFFCPTTFLSSPHKKPHQNKSHQNGGYFDGLLGVFRERKQPNASGKGTLVY
tara:strand:- start:2122 stop:2640 length:519 start_codon:yes stop_codon:yes gene_type:complete